MVSAYYFGNFDSAKDKQCMRQSKCRAHLPTAINHNFAFCLL